MSASALNPHLRADSESSGAPSRRLARACAAAALAAVLSVALECATLIGAPLSTPFCADDWHVGRMAVFFVMMLPVGAFVSFFDWRSWRARLLARWREDGPKRLQRALGGLAVVTGSALAAAFVSGLAYASADVDYVWPYQAFFAVLAAVVVSAVLLRASLAERPERMLLVMLLASGFIMVVASPPYTHISWDDQIHYDRTVAASYLVDPEYTPADIALVNRHYNDVAKYSRQAGAELSSLPYDESRLQSIGAELDKLAQNTASSVRVEGSNTLGGSRIIHYSLVAYVPGAIALWLSRLLSLSFTAGFLLGRLANALAYALVIYVACRRLRSGKLIMAVCALVPTAVFLAANYSYDFWVTCFMMLGFAYFIGELQRPCEPLTWKNLAIMVGAFLVGLGPKAIYVPVAAMLLFMPRAKFNGSGSLTHRKYVTIILLSGLAVLSTFVLPMFVEGPGSGDSRGGDVNPSEQIAFILGEPFAYASIFWDFLQWYVHPDQAVFVMGDFCGIESAYGMVDFLMLLIPLTALLDRARCDLTLATHPKRLCMLGLTVLTILLMATALYISFTPPRWDIIAGMQGRYLIPLMFPFFALCLPFKPLVRLADRLDRRFLNMAILALAAYAIFGSMFDVMILRY